MNAGGADDRLARHREFDRMEDERPGLRAAESAVEGDQLLERASLFEVGFVEAIDQDVRRIVEPARPQQVSRGIW